MTLGCKGIKKDPESFWWVFWAWFQRRLGLYKEFSELLRCLMGVSVCEKNRATASGCCLRLFWRGSAWQGNHIFCDKN